MADHARPSLLSLFLLLAVAGRHLITVDAFLVFSAGVCPQVTVKQNFNITKYQGAWYSYENFDAPYQFGMSCVTANYRLLGDNSVEVINEGFREIRIFGITLSKTPISAEGRATILDKADPARLRVQFGNQPDFGFGEVKPNYQVIDTDYENYSLVYSCSTLFIPFKLEGAWILTRVRGMRPPNTYELESKLESFGIRTKYFKMVDHNNC